MVTLAGAMAGLQVAGTSAYLGKQYGLPAARGIANLALHNRKRKSALHYVQNLGKKKGMKRFVQKDLGRGLASGLDILEKTGKLSGQLEKTGKKMGYGMVSDKKGGDMSHVHQIFEKYNVQPKAIHSHPFMGR